MLSCKVSGRLLVFFSSQAQCLIVWSATFAWIEIQIKNTSVDLPDRLVSKDQSFPLSGLNSQKNLAWRSSELQTRKSETALSGRNSRDLLSETVRKMCYQTNVAACFKNKEAEMDGEMTANCNMVVQ